jgi:hypothetical protein
MPFPYEEFDLSGIQTYPLKSRASKARAEDFAKPYRPGSGLSGWLDSLPSILAAADFRAVVAAVCEARTEGRGIVWGFGAHVIKTGLSPILIDLMERGFVSAMATNGAGLIHDFEIALSGATSEDVDTSLGQGRFGMADETGRLLNGALNEGVAAGLGLGQAAGRYLCARHPQHEHSSVVAAAFRLGIPLTVHVAIGTDIIHMHPAASGAALGEGSLRDFRYFASNVSRLEKVRNRGCSLDGLTTVTLDFARLYRPQVNVVVRPTAGIGRGYYIVGHHELLIPLLAAALVERSEKP